MHRWISFLSAQSCYHKLPQAQRLRRTHVYFHTVLDVRSISSVSLCMCVCKFSHVQLLETPWATASSVHGILQARIMECMPCPPPGDLPKPHLFCLLHWQAGVFFTTCATSAKVKLLVGLVHSANYEGKICFFVFFSYQ